MEHTGARSAAELVAAAEAAPGTSEASASTSEDISAKLRAALDGALASGALAAAAATVATKNTQDAAPTPASASDVEVPAGAEETQPAPFSPPPRTKSDADEPDSPSSMRNNSSPLESIRSDADQPPSRLSSASSCDAVGGSPKTKSPRRKRSSKGLSKKKLSAAALAEIVHRTARMSSAPEFWKAVEESLANWQELLVGAEEDLGDQGVEELTVVILSWLHDAIAWDVRQNALAEMAAAAADSAVPAAMDRPPPLISDQDSISETMSVASNDTRDTLSTMPPAGASWASKATARLKRRFSSTNVGVEVIIHIYDVSQEDSIRKLNKFLAHRFSPVKLGGVFHAGVEVNGLEWSFGSSWSDTVPGISCVEPKTHPQHTFRQTVNMRRTKRSEEDIADIIAVLIEDYPGHDYDLLRRNCCHFADDFCRRLGVGGIPGWVHRLARVGARVDSVMQATMNRGLLPAEYDSDSS